MRRAVKRFPQKSLEQDPEGGHVGSQPNSQPWPQQEDLIEETLACKCLSLRFIIMMLYCCANVCSRCSMAAAIFGGRELGAFVSF